MPPPNFAFAACAVGCDIYAFGGYDGRGQAQFSVY
jgi:hypothetical protein